MEADEVKAAAREGFAEGMITAAMIVDRIAADPLPPTPGVDDSYRRVADETLKAALRAAAQAIRVAAPTWKR